MDIAQTVSGYITKMVSTGEGAQAAGAAKMKILLLDTETVGMKLQAWHKVYEAHAPLGSNRLVGDHAVCASQPQCLPHRSP